MVGTSFGSPLMSLLPINCAGLHLNGGSGVGKTTAMNTALSVWGNHADLLIFEKDTHNSMMNRGTNLRTLRLENCLTLCISLQAVNKETECLKVET